MVSGPAGSLCLSLYLCFSGFLDLHLFLILMSPAPVLLTGVVCSCGWWHSSTTNDSGAGKGGTVEWVLRTNLGSGGSSVGREVTHLF